ncbi:MAG TPA: DUF3313 domain-containing protein [Phycisphaerales bacterium]|nr:DUF3313 domain-containing protein [Phycisphaerales bacterium]
MKIHSRWSRPRMFGAWPASAGVVAGAALVLGGCASKPKPTQSGFLSTYERLESRDAYRSEHVSPELARYERFIVHPVEVRVEPDLLTADDLAGLAEHFHSACVRVLEAEGLIVTGEPGEGVARVRLALTDIAKSTPWQKIHPGARFAGAGTGGAAMEGEIVDSITGEQLAAVVRADSGNQFNLTAFSTVDDVRGAIDKWAADGARALRELRAARDDPPGP